MDGFTPYLYFHAVKSSFLFKIMIITKVRFHKSPILYCPFKMGLWDESSCMDLGTVEFIIGHFSAAIALQANDA